jgi:hypothetical protein
MGQAWWLKFKNAAEGTYGSSSVEKIKNVKGANGEKQMAPGCGKHVGVKSNASRRVTQVSFKLCGSCPKC